MAPAIAQQELQDLCDTLEDALWPELFVTLADTGTTVTATKGSTTVTLTETDGVWSGVLDSFGTWTVSGTRGGSQTTTVVNVSTVKQYEVSLISPVLDLNNWSDISAVSQDGVAGSYWSVGDTKSVVINGTIGTQSIDTTLYAYIIGINHGGINGVTFQGFKTAQTDGTDVCLDDSHYTSSSSDGSKWFNMNHWGSYNYGGWKGCDLRYDILGSTDVAPSGYGAAVVSGSRVGYDATSTAATNPVVNTFMAALPSELRAVMRPMTVYTDNYSGSPHNTESYVTASVDYLPLLAEFEIFGARTYANQYEQDNQTQYAYYSSGNSKVKYRHSSTGSTANWWERSPFYNGAAGFCLVSPNGGAYADDSHRSFGVAPAFMV